MFPLKIAILDTGEFTGLTEQSIKVNLPDAEYWVHMADSSKSLLENAYLAAEGELTLVVLGGIVLELTTADIPPVDVLKQYHLAAPRSAVFSDHGTLGRFYSYVEGEYHKKLADLSICIINPEMWGDTPTFKLSDKRILAMPRYMDHKTDILVTNGISPYQALKYGMLGEQAAVFNYLPLLTSGEATPIERYAYNLNKLRKYTDLLSDEAKAKIETIIGPESIVGMRDKLAETLGYAR